MLSLSASLDMGSFNQIFILSAKDLVAETHALLKQIQPSHQGDPPDLATAQDQSHHLQEEKDAASCGGLLSCQLAALASVTEENTRSLI